MKWVARTAAALIAVHLVVRAVLAFRGYFYWDDLILTGRAGTQGLLSRRLSVRRSRRTRDARGVPGGGRHHPTRAVELDRPAISLVVLQLDCVSGAAARAARDSRLAAGAAASVDVRVVHAARPAAHSRGGRRR